MIEKIFNSWQKRIIEANYQDSLPLFQQRNLFTKMLQALFADSKEIYYLLPEIIDMAERHCTDYRHFINTLFILRDVINEKQTSLRNEHLDVELAKRLLEEVILKIGSYFSHLRMDLNIRQNQVTSFESEKIEANILHLNDKFIIEKTNSTLLPQFGYHKQEVIGKPLHFLFSASSQTLLKKSLAQLKNNLRFKIDLEIEAQNKKGRRFQALLKISRTNLNRFPPTYIAYIQDNTYIHETKSMLNLMSMALESVGEGIVLLEPKEEGNILYVNEAIEKMSGYHRHQLLGKPFHVLRDSQSDGALEKEIIRKSLQDGWHGELVNLHKSGHEYMVDLHTQPVKDEYGNTVAIVGVERDITQEKAHQAQILHLKQFVERIINNLPHFVFVTDKHLRIKFWNQSLEEELHIPASQAINQSTFDILPQLERFHLDLASKSVLSTGEMFSKKIFTELANSGERYYQIHITPIETASERQLLWTILDITKEELLKVQITWQNARLKFLENFSQILNSNLDIRSIFNRFTTELKDVLPFNSLVFLLPYHQEKLQFNLFYRFYGETEDFPRNEIVDLSRIERYHRLSETMEPTVENLAALPEETATTLRQMHGNVSLGQVTFLPIHSEKELLGVLQIGHEEQNFLRKNDLEFLQQIASHLAISLKNSFYFKLIELQNKKLFIVNSIFNVPQNLNGIPLIYQNTLEGISELLVSEDNAIYYSEDGVSWRKIAGSLQKSILPSALEFPAKKLPGNSHFWDVLTPPLLDIPNLEIQDHYHSGLFLYHPATQGYYAILSVNLRILNQNNLKIVSALLQDILKQMILAIDQIQLFDRIKTTEQRWETTFNTVEIGLAIVDEKFRFVQTNKAFSTIYGIYADNFLGKTCGETFCPFSDSSQCCMRLSPNIKNDFYEKEYTDPRTQRTLIRTFYPILDNQKRFRGGVFLIYDITEKRSQEEKIRFLSKFPETNPNLVISLNRNGEVIYINPSTRKVLNSFNLSEKDIQFILPDHLSEFLKKYRDKKELYLELEKEFQNRVFHYLIYRPSSEDYYYLYGNEITERVELQRQLLQTERIRAIGEMAAGVAHDFNNLLATILGRTQLLLLKTENPQIQNELKVIEKAAIDGGQIVKRMQEVTRERRAKNYEPLDLNELIKESIILTANKLKISTQLKGFPVQLRTDFQDNLVVKGNPVELKEVFTNLLLNAYDALPNGGEIYISTRKTDDDQAQVIFKDTGIGMPEEVRQKIFNPFFTTKGDKGTGLGLSIAYRTISSHGGNINVESEVGVGTTFTIILPLTSEQVKKKRGRESFSQEKIGEVHLLIVDDEPELLETMAEILRLKFKTVEIAPNGHDALAKIEAHKFDVILTDLGMPEMSGWELARLIKKKLPDSRVIMVTGWGEQAREELKHHPYVDDVLPKPYELKDLIQKISRFYTNQPVLENGV